MKITDNDRRQYNREKLEAIVADLLAVCTKHNIMLKAEDIEEADELKLDIELLDENGNTMGLLGDVWALEAGDDPDDAISYVSHKTFD